MVVSYVKLFKQVCINRDPVNDSNFVSMFRKLLVS
jgi:hypothetical protein